MKRTTICADDDAWSVIEQTAERQHRSVANVIKMVLDEVGKDPALLERLIVQATQGPHAQHRWQAGWTDPSEEVTP